jgi:hypothetical protein
MESISGRRKTQSTKRSDHKYKSSTYQVADYEAMESITGGRKNVEED